MLVRSIAPCRRSVPLASTLRTISTRPPALQNTFHASCVSYSRTLRRSHAGHLGNTTAYGAERALSRRIVASWPAQTRRYTTDPSTTKPILPDPTQPTSQVSTLNDATTASPPPELRESPWTIPNAITIARILSCPILGYCVVKGEFEWATGILVVGGFSDWLDGYIARRFNMRSVFGTILDPAADKTLMTTLVVTLAYKGLLPMPLAVLILGRDVALSLSAFWYRYISLPEPKTFKRYWDFSIPSAEVRPTQISKYNTALQLVLMGTTTISPLLGVDISMPRQALQWTVAGTTIWSGLSYIGSKDAVKILSKK